MANPGAIHATVPEQGRKLTFLRSLQVETNTDLQIRLVTRAATTAPSGLRLGLVAGVVVLLGALSGLARARR